MKNSPDPLLGGPVDVTGSTGANGTYSSLNAAFVAINANPTQTGNAINININSDTTEATTATLNAGDWASMTISPTGGAARTISGAIAAGSPLIDFNGADNVTIDGLNTGGNSLTIANTTVSATSGTSTIRFIGGATNNTITNSNIQGSGTMSVATNGAIIFFSTDALTANGNDNNTISNNNIGPAGANLPTKAILGNGSTTTTAIGNSGIIINNNNIFDFFGAAVTSAGVATNGGCNTWSITNNRFYQTGTRTWTTGALHTPINIANTTATSGAQGFTITGNTIGYASNAQTGTYTLTGGVTGTRFVGIFFNGISTGAASTVSNNTIAAVNMSGVLGSGTSTGSPFAAILFQEGVGITSNNTIGSQTGTGSLTFSTTTTTATDVYGIFNFSSNIWTANSNNIGSISATNLGASGTFVIYGLRANTATATAWTATSNLVGGTTANSIQLTATGTASQVIGMHTSNAPALFTSNTIRNLTTNIGTGTTTLASLIGINVTTSTPIHTLSQNTIFNLNNTNTTAASVVTGIQFTGATANVVERNYIYGINAATNSAAAEVNGIRVGGGTSVYRNNMITIGSGTPNAIGTGSTTGGVNGINEPLGTNNFFHNSVYVRGTATAGVGPSYAFNSSPVTVARSFRDNIFFNARANSGATGKNYILRVGGTSPNPTGLTINNNLYFANGSGAVFGFFNSLDVADLNAWKTAVGQDSASFVSNPQYNDPDNAIPDLHLHPTNSTVAEGNGADVGVVNDFDGQIRSGLTPVDIGADAGNFSGIDLSAPSISYSPLLNTSSTANRVQTVSISDATGVAVGGTAPRIYFNKNAGVYSSTACILTAGTVQNGTWSCTIDNALLGGVVATDVVRYFVVAQDTLGNLAANPSAGFSGTNVNTVTTAPTTPIQYTVVTTYSGSLSIGSAESVTSLTNTGGLFELINNGTVSGNLVINLTSDLTAETGTVALNQTVEEGAGGYTITFQSSGVARLISGSNTTALINLNGADRVTLSGLAFGPTGLTIRNTSATTGAVVLMTNDASNNSIVNCIIEGGNTSTSSALILLATGVTTGNDSNSVTSSIIRDRTDAVGVPANLIASLNASTTAKNSDNIITGSQLTNFINNGFATSSGATSDNWTVTNNDVSQNATRAGSSFAFNTGGMTGTNTFSGNSIHGFVSSGANAILGFLVGNSLNLTISGNRIYDFQTTAGATGVIEGVEFDGASGGAANLTFVNNMISLAPTVSTAQTVIGIQDFGFGGNTFSAYYNTILIGGTASGAANSWAMKRGNAAPTTFTARNNIAFNNRTGGTGNHFAGGDDSANTGTFVSNYNFFAGTGATAANFMDYGTASTGTAVSFAAWQTGPPTRDANSTGDLAANFVVTNIFVDVANNDLHLKPTAPVSILDAGTPVAGITTDFDGQTRSAVTPDIGADEIDTNPPDTQILTNPSNPSTSADATFTFSGTDSALATVASFECKLDMGMFAACTSPKTYLGLAQGIHNFQVRAIDAAGNIDPTPASYTWTIDAIAPDTQILTNPTDPSNSADATFTFSGTDSFGLPALTFECKLDAAMFAACTSPKTYMMLADGSHTFQVRAIDSVGNVDPTPASYTWTINTAPAGPVTVAATAGTATGSYNNLTEAIAAVNDGTHQGNIVVSINQTITEPGTVIINSSGAGAAAYTSLLIRPTADGLSDSGASAQGRGLIELNGADNVTIDGDNPNTAGTNRDLTLQNTAANTVTFTSVIRIALATTVVNSADNNTFKNLNILGSATGRNIGTATTTTGTENTTFGILAGLGASTVSATTAPAAITSVATSIGTGATAVNLLVSNNSITTAARGVSVNGSATTVFPGLQINGNTIGNQTAGAADQVYAIGITAQGSANGLISGNTVWVEGFVASSASNQGINVGVNSASGTFTIDSNKVNRVRSNSVATFNAYGINLGGGSNHIVQNNFVAGVSNDQTAGTGAFSTTFGAFGIRVGSGTGHKVYHNSVNLYGPLPGVISTDLTAAFGITATTLTGVDVRNNIFSNQITGGNPTGTRNVAIFLPSAATVTMNLTLNNNAYYAGTDALNRLAQVGTTFGAGEYLIANFDPTATTPATNFRAYSSPLSAAGTNDNASFASSSAPPFTSNVDLHIPASTATRLESGGAAVGVLSDIDLDMRNAVTPDIGADEFAGLPAPANDIAATVLVNPANGASVPVGLTFSPQASFLNNGTAAQTNVTVRYRIIDSSMSVVYNQTALIASIAPLQSQTVTFPSTSLPSAGTFTIQASAELVGDQTPGNDTISGTITGVTPISGSINVGAGETYTSLTNPGGLFQALNTAGISGNTVINITSDLTAETGTVMLNQLGEVGAGGYTTTFKPSGAARTISGTAAASTGLIVLNGADRIIFDGSLSGGNDRSLTITNNQTGTSTVVWVRSASAANGANNNTFKNCIINGATGATATTTAGILTGSGVTIGSDGEAPNNNNTVQNNWIYRVQNSLYLRGGTVLANFDQNWTVTGNELGSTNSTADKNIFRGMLIGNSANFMIAGNLVHGIQSTGTTTAAMNGIQVALLVNGGMIANNVISDIKNISTTGTGAFGVSIGSTSTASNVTIANNFISNVTTTGLATVTSNGFGLMFNGSGTGYNVYFNSINMNTDQGAGTTSAAMFVNSTFATAGAIDVRNNIFANNETTGVRYGVYSTAAATVFSTIDFNDYFAQNVGFIGGSARTTLVDWQTGTSQDVNSKAVDPLFVSASNLHIQTGSPMVGMAVTGTGITTDIDGETRDAMPDIGADELPPVAMPGTLQFSAATYSVGESGGMVTLTVNRTGGSDGAVTVDYALAGGTATGGATCGAGVDYVNTGGTVSFANAQTSKTFNVTICSDSVFEGDETFNATLSNAMGGATIGTPNPAVVTIIDDDPIPGTFTVNDVRVTEGNSGTVNATFTVTYTGNNAPASVQYATANGTAVAGVDYAATSGTLNFGLTLGKQAGTPTQTQTVTVVVNGDTMKEANETFFLNLSNPTNATITDNQGVGIIIDEDRAYVSDFDGDRNSDFSVFRPSDGLWYVLQSTNATPKIVPLGTNGDRPVPGDYDGDGLADYAIFRDGTWYILNSSNSSQIIVNWGLAGDKPVQGDYDGDGKTDVAIFRPSTGTWWVIRSSDSNSYAVQFGISTDKPVQGDFDGDFKTDIAVYRDGTWYILKSSNGAVAIQNWGLATDTPVSGDFDGDGKFDLAVYRNGDWWIISSLTGATGSVHWGATGDLPVVADYDRDGTSDIAIFRPSSGDWYVLRSSNGVPIVIHWGLNGDIPTPAAYLPQ